MTVSERMKLVRTIEKVNENKEFSKKLGIMNASVFKNPSPKKYIVGVD